MKYYYLLATLPDLDSTDIRELSSIDYEEVFDLIARNLTPADREIYHFILYPNDIRNILGRLYHHYDHKPLPPLHYPSVLDEEEIADAFQNPVHLPDFMFEFISAYRGARSSDTLPDVWIYSLFYEAVQKTANPFLIEYFEWKYGLEDTLAHLNRLHFPIEIADPLPMTDAVVKSPVIDKKELQAALAPLLDNHQYVKFEKKVDNIYRSFYEHWRTGYAAESVWAYTVLLLRLSRWQYINKEGKGFMNKLNTLTDQALNKETYD